MRLIAGSGVLAVYTAILYPRGLLDQTPTVLGLRTFAIRRATPSSTRSCRSGRCSTALARVARDARAARAEPTGRSRCACRWRCPRSPGRASRRRGADGERSARPTSDLLQRRAGGHRRGRRGRADRARASSWSAGPRRGVGPPDRRPRVRSDAAPAFAAESLGFLGDDEPVTIHETGTWTRLTTRRGHILVRRRPGRSAADPPPEIASSKNLRSPACHRVIEERSGEGGSGAGDRAAGLAAGEQAAAEEGALERPVAVHPAAAEAGSPRRPRTGRARAAPSAPSTRPSRSVSIPPRLLRVRMCSFTAMSGPAAGSSSLCGAATRMSWSPRYFARRPHGGELQVLAELVVELAVALVDVPRDRSGVERDVGDPLHPREQVVERVGDDEVRALLLERLDRARARPGRRAWRAGVRPCRSGRGSARCRRARTPSR